MLIDGASGCVLAQLRPPTFASAVAAFRPDGRQLAAGELEGEISIFDVEAQRLVRQLFGARRGRLASATRATGGPS